jgi:hypothetical protein
VSSQDRAKAFLAAYRVTASITGAAKAAHMERDLHYRWLKEDENYRKAFDQAKEEAAQSLEDEAVRRATEGDFEPNVFKGKFCYAESDYVEDLEGKITLKRGAKPLGIYRRSDTLLQFLLKGLRPEKYRDSFKGELTVAASVEVKLEEQKLKALTDDELERLIAITTKLAAVDPDDGGSGTPQAK